MQNAQIFHKELENDKFRIIFAKKLSTFQSP